MTPVRTNGSVRCPRCALQAHLCLCAEVEPLQTNTRVVVLRHRKERHRTTNTGRLVPLTLVQGEIQLFGERSDVLDASRWTEPGRRALLLYPGAGARILAPDDSAREPVTLVVPDANWRRAFKLAEHDERLRGLERVALPPGPPSAYRLRRHPDERYLATFEAVARALGILEGAELQSRLERVFALLVERTLQSRGRAPGDIH